MPTWHAAMYSSIRSICFSASTAPLAPSFASAWMRSSRERTIEYSAATKNAFMRMSAGTPSRRTASTSPQPETPETAAYFEGGLGQASGSDRRLPEPPGGTCRVVEPRRPVALVLPHREHAPAGARDPRPPGVPAARAGVAHEARPAALQAAAPQPRHAHHAPPGARILERHERARPGRPCRSTAQNVDTWRPPYGSTWRFFAARRGDERVVLRVRLRSRRRRACASRSRRSAACPPSSARVGRVGELLLVGAVVGHPDLSGEALAAVARQRARTRPTRSP